MIGHLQVVYDVSGDNNTDYRRCADEEARKEGTLSHVSALWSSVSSVPLRHEFLEDRYGSLPISSKRFSNQYKRTTTTAVLMRTTWQTEQRIKIATLGR